MTMQEITINEFEELIFIELQIEINIIDIVRIMKFEFPHIRYTGITTEQPSNLSKYRLYSNGIALAEYLGDDFRLLPTIYSYTKGIKTIELGYTQLEPLTFGKTIKFNTATGLYIIKDNFGRKISLVKVQNNEMKPIIDLGYYLRNETIA